MAIDAALLNQGTLLAFGLVFLGGIVTSIGPCNLATVPLLVGYVGGTATPGRGRALTLSLAFAIGLATTFMLLGVAAALVGKAFTGLTNWGYYLLAAVCFVLALVMLGRWIFRCPPKLPICGCESAGKACGEKIMLIDSYDLDIFTPPCEPGAERFSAVARLPVDISKTLPLLNATLRGAVYHQEANALTWKKGGHSIAFHAFEIATSNVADRHVARKELDGLVQLVNRTWERRSEITPSYQMRRRPTPMAVFQLLPQTNCKRCGEQTCFTFALKLIAGQHQLADCPILLEPEYKEKRQQLEQIVIDVPAIG